MSSRPLIWALALFFLLSSTLAAQDSLTVDRIFNSKDFVPEQLGRVRWLENKAAVAFNPQDDIDTALGFPETRNVRVNKGDSYTFTVTASNIDTTSLGSLQGTLVESPANTFTFTPGDDGDGLEPGSYPITFQLSDATDVRSDSYLVINFIVQRAVIGIVF